MYGHSVTHSVGDCLQSCQLAGTYDATPFVRQKNQVSIVTAHNRNLIFLMDTPPRHISMASHYPCGPSHTNMTVVTCNPIAKIVLR